MTFQTITYLKLLRTLSFTNWRNMYMFSANVLTNEQGQNRRSQLIVTAAVLYILILHLNCWIDFISLIIKLK